MSAPGNDMTAAERKMAGRIAGARSTKTKADEFALTMKPVLFQLKTEGIVGRTEVANTLNSRGYPSPGRKRWTVTTVTNLLGRIAVMKVME